MISAVTAVTDNTAEASPARERSYRRYHLIASDFIHVSLQYVRREATQLAMAVTGRNEVGQAVRAVLRSGGSMLGPGGTGPPNLAQTLQFFSG